MLLKQIYQIRGAFGQGLEKMKFHILKTNFMLEGDMGYCFHYNF